MNVQRSKTRPAHTELKRPALSIKTATTFVWQRKDQRIWVTSKVNGLLMTSTLSMDTGWSSRTVHIQMLFRLGWFKWGVKVRVRLLFITVTKVTMEVEWSGNARCMGSGMVANQSAQRVSYFPNKWTVHIKLHYQF